MRRFPIILSSLVCCAVLMAQVSGLHLHASSHAENQGLHGAHVHGADPDGHDHAADVDVSVFEIIREVAEGKFTGGEHVYGLEIDGVGYALDQYNENLLTQDVMDRVEEIKADIVAGRIHVTDYTELR